MEQDLRIIEINGIKMEVDLRTARRIDNFKVGDNVKILEKEYSNDYVVRPGIIVDFCEFQSLPTITIAVLHEGSWSTSPSIKFLHYNEKTKDTIEIVYASKDELRLSKDGIIEKFERVIEEKKNEYIDLQNQLDYFRKHFLDIERN